MAEQLTEQTTEADAPGNSVRQEIVPEIGIWGALAIGIGTMIAAGIFVLSGLAVANVGTVAIVSFLIAAVVAGFTAFAYAEFASIYQESGGGYMYVANTFDTNLTYIVGWSMILGYPASAAFYIASFSDWFYRFIYPVFNIPEAIPFWVASLVILAILVGINLKGTSESGKFQIVVTVLKIILLILFLYGGLQAFEIDIIAQSFVDHIDEFRQIGLTSALVFITFFGFEAIATSSEEIEDPGTTVPRAIFISMGFTTIVYTLVVTVIVLAVNDPGFLNFLKQKAALVGIKPIEFVRENGEVAMGRVAQYYLGDIGFYIIIVGALFSMISGANATVLAGSRVKLAMARRDHLPKQFENIHSKFRTPFNAVLLTGGIIFFYIVLFSMIFGEVPGAVTESAPLGIETLAGLHLGIDALAHFADFLLLAGLIAVNLAVIQSRRKYPDVERDFRVPLVPWIPIFAIIANLALLISVEGVALIMGLIAEVVGIVFWFGWKSRTPSVEEMEAETPTAMAEYGVKTSEHDYQLVVPLANPDHVEPLMNTAISITKDQEGELLIVSVVTVPNQTPLSYGRKHVKTRKKVINKAQKMADEANVPVHGIIRIGHHAGEAILNTIIQHNSQAVLMGWHGRRGKRRDVVLGTTVDKVVEEAECDVFVEKVSEKKAEHLSSILVPTGGGPHGQFAVETGLAIARQYDATLRLIRVIEPTASENERDRVHDKLQEIASEYENEPIETDIVEGTDIATTLSREAKDFDIVMIGSTQESLLHQFVFGALPETISERIPKTVIMVKRQLPARSRLKKSLQKLWPWN